MEGYSTTLSPTNTERQISVYTLRLFETLWPISTGNLSLSTLCLYKWILLHIILWYNKLNILSASMQTKPTIYAIVETKSGPLIFFTKIKN
jgi:hypothetical protein